MTEESYQRERAAKRRTEESQVRKNRLRRAFQELREAGRRTAHTQWIEPDITRPRQSGELRLSVHDGLLHRGLRRGHIVRYQLCLGW